MPPAMQPLVPKPLDPPHYDVADPRIYFAAERTLLAWVRTGLALMGFGFVVARFGLFLREMAIAGRGEPHQPTGLSLYLGTAMVGIGVVVTIAASAKHWRTVGRLRRGEPVWPKPISLEIILGGVLAVVGLTVVGYLIRLM